MLLTELEVTEHIENIYVFISTKKFVVELQTKVCNCMQKHIPIIELELPPLYNLYKN